MKSRQLSKNNAIKVKSKKPLRKTSIILLALLLSLSGCAKNNQTGLDSAQEEIITNIDSSTFLSDIFYIESDNVIILNDYEDYKEYLIDPEPTYTKLYKVVEENQNMPKEYKQVYTQIIALFEKNSIPTKNLAILYHNLTLLNIKTNYQAGTSSEEITSAFFVPDPENPAVYVDPRFTDFYSMLHECIHSCKIALIRDDDKIIYITCKGIDKILVDKENEATIIKTYGRSFSEGQAECISQTLYNYEERIAISAYSYNINNSILAFWVDSLGIDLKTFLSYSIKDFEESLINLGIPQKNVKDIIIRMDSLLINNESSLENDDVRYLFYQNYIPNLIEDYIKLGYSSSEIYSIIGTSLKTSIIENIHDENDIEYRDKYLNNQKKLFDMIDNLISEKLIEHNIETSSIYYYIGHEFQIYYELYGEGTDLNTGSYYLAHNWDEEATKNCNILLYTEGNSIKMGVYAENLDGSLSCYNYYGELKNIKNGAKLSDLLNFGAINITDGYINFNYSHEKMIELINTWGNECIYKKEAVNLSEDKYLYYAEQKGTICNLTTNAEGEEIPYYIFSNQIYLLPENSQKISSIKELYENGVINLDDDYNLTYDIDALNTYLKQQSINFQSNKR